MISSSTAPVPPVSPLICDTLISSDAGPRVGTEAGFILCEEVAPGDAGCNQLIGPTVAAAAGSANASSREEVQDQDVAEDVQPVRCTPIPWKPSQEEVEEHRLHHRPYKPWCEFCVRGKAQGQHHTESTHESTIAVVGLDYFYLTAGGIKLRSELGVDDATVQRERLKGSLVKALLVRCHRTRAVFAFVVPSKGANEDGYVVQLVVKSVAWLGHARLILKADNENAL